MYYLEDKSKRQEQEGGFTKHIGLKQETDTHSNPSLILYPSPPDMNLPIDASKVEDLKTWDTIWSERTSLHVRMNTDLDVGINIDETVTSIKGRTCLLGFQQRNMNMEQYKQEYFWK